MKHCLTLLVALSLASVAQAHDGPPYPVLVDEEVAGSVVSVWADPDVGVGTFYVYTPGDVEIGIAVEPDDGHVDEAFFQAEAAEDGEPFQLVGKVDFDRRGPWNVRFLVEGPGGSGEMFVPVDVTPPGLGKIDLIWFLSPFLAIAFLWIKVALAKRDLHRTSS